MSHEVIFTKAFDKDLEVMSKKRPNALKNHCLAQKINDIDWSGFVNKLTYKAEWLGKTILKIGRFETSSKLCNVCGYKNKELTLDIREWECPDFKTLHYRDINAGINIKNFTLQEQNMIET